MSPSRVTYSKPAVHRLHAEVPCNYTLGRLAAALLSVFESVTRLPTFFNIDIKICHMKTFTL